MLAALAALRGVCLLQDQSTPAFSGWRSHKRCHLGLVTASFPEASRSWAGSQRYFELWISKRRRTAEIGRGWINVAAAMRDALCAQRTPLRSCLLQIWQQKLLHVCEHPQQAGLGAAVRQACEG